jgi:hypothetical protein
MRLVYLELASAQELLGLAVPPETLAALRPADPLPADLLDRLFGLHGQPSGRAPVAVVQAGAKGTPLARLRHSPEACGTSFCPATAWPWSTTCRPTRAIRGMAASGNLTRGQALPVCRPLGFLPLKP